MKTGVWNVQFTVLAGVMLLSAVTVAQRGEADTPYLLRVVESDATTRYVAGPHIMENCLLVEGDGSMYLQLRRLEIIGEPPTLLAFEAKLKPEWMKRLRAILDEEKLTTLAPYKGPVLPLDGHDLSHWFGAEINRGSTLQHVGYFNWEGKGPRNEQGDKERWNEARTILGPLAEWSRSAKMSNALKWQAVPYGSRACFDPDEDQEE
jgi:hypothetical protein